MPSALGATADKAPVENQPGYTRMSALHRDLEELVGISSMFRVSRRVRRSIDNWPVSNTVPEGTKLQ